MTAVRIGSAISTMCPLYIFPPASELFGINPRGLRFSSP
jgi:hypothetical protein